MVDNELVLVTGAAAKWSVGRHRRRPATRSRPSFAAMVGGANDETGGVAYEPPAPK